MEYKERQSGKAYVEFFLASLVVATMVIGGFSYVGKTVNDHVDEISTTLLQEPERTVEGEVVVTDAFLNQFGPTAAGPQDSPPQPLFSVTPDGSIKVTLTTEVVLWGVAMLSCLVLSVLLFRLAIRR